MTTRLLTVQGPLQFLAGRIALEWFRRRTPAAQGDEDVLLLYDFLAAPDAERGIADAIVALSEVAPWKRVEFISGAQMAGIMRGRYDAAIRRLHDRLGAAHFDEIYLARDYIGDGSPLLMNAFPAARKIAYGDSLGLVGQRAALARAATRPTPRERLSAGRQWLRRRWFGAPRPYPFDAAVLTLPIDMSGHYFDAVELVVPPRAHAVGRLEENYARTHALREYCRGLLERHGPCPLYLLSNLSASSLTTEENEIALYVEVIRAESRPGSTVFIKQHPRSSTRLLDAVVERLREDCTPLVLDEANAARSPIEVWVDMIRACPVTAMFSTSAINLKYLYDRDIGLPLTPERIGRYFPPATAGYMAEGVGMMRQAIADLAQWDGASPLWSPANARQ